MISKYLKKMICSLIAVLMVITAVPVNAIAFEMEQIGESVDAEENVVASDVEEDIFFEEVEQEAETLATTPAKVDDAIVAERLATLKKLKGKFFTVNGTYCKKPGVPRHGCTNCQTTYLIKTDLLDLMPSKENNLPRIILHGEDNYLYGTRQSCAAFATIAHWYLYAQKSTDSVKVDFVEKDGKKCSGEFNKNTLSGAKPGDIIGLTYKSGSHYHSMIFLGFASGGINVLDCNSDNETYGNCRVYETFFPYSSKYNVAVSRATNYVEHIYDDYGYCSHCKKYYEEINANKIENIEGTVKRDGKIYVKAHPYRGVSGVNQDELEKGTYKIIGRIKNHKETTWYKISYGSSKTGWIYPEDYYTIDIKNTINIELGMNKSSIPKGTSVWPNDTSKAYNYSAKVSSSNGVSKITSVTFEILKSNGTLTASNNRITKKPNAVSYAIKTSDDTTKFSELAVGSYILSLSATDENGKTANKKYNFTVYDNTSSNIPVTGVSISKTEITLNKGETYSLIATVTPSNATNKKVSWISASPSTVAKVSSSGVVTAIGSGETMIKVTTEDGQYTAFCKVKVPIEYFSVSYDLNGGNGNISGMDIYEGAYITISTTVPTRPGYTFVGWQESGTVGTNDWVTTKPSSGDYQTGYKYYTWGYEHNSDYTYLYGDDKNELIEHIKKNSGTFGSYNLKKMRYFSLIESSDKGSSYYPGKSGTNYNYFNVDYISEDGKTGTASIYKTVFYFESKVYKQEATGGKIYQPGDSYKVTKDVIFTAVWEEEQEVSYGVTFDANGGIGGPLFARTIGTQFTVPEEIPTRENWVFLYWGGNKGIYRPGETYTISEDEELVAYWAPAWTPEITVGDVLVNPGDTIGVPIYIYNAKEPENTTIRFSVTSDAFTRTKYEYADEIPEYGCLGTAYFEIPEDAEPGEYPVSFNLTEYKISSGYIITDTVKIFDGSITVTDKKICTVTFDRNDGWEANTEKLEEGTSISFNDIYFEREGYTAECLKITEETKWGPRTYLADKNDMIYVSSDMEIKTIWRNNSVEYPVISSKEIKAKPGDTVTVQVETSFKNGFAFGEWLLQWKNDQNIELKSSYNCSGENGNNIIYEFVFEIGDDVAPGKHSWNFSIVEAYTQEGELWAVKDIPITISVEKSNYGDLNGDNEVNIKDAYLARLIAAKLITATEVQSTLGDVDLDGKITAIDANLIRKYVVKLIDSLPIN